MTTSQTVAEEISALLRARNPLIWVVTKEEARAERYIFEAAQRAKYVPYTWDNAAGFCDMAGTSQNGAIGDIDEALGQIRQRVDNMANGNIQDQRAVFVLRDITVWITGIVGAGACRKLRNLARFLPSVQRDFAHSVIVITPSKDIPPELQGHATLIEWPIPDREEIAGILDATLSALPEKIRKTALADGDRDAAIEAAIGLSGEESQSCYARSLVQTRTIDPKMVAAEKKRLIARERLLEWIDPLPGGLNDVGGLDILKSFLLTRRLAYSPEARAYGLPAPRGVLIVGVSGCLAEGTRIAYKRGKRPSAGDRTLPIEALYQKFNGFYPVQGCGRAGAGSAWIPSVPTYAQSWDSETGSIVFNEITAVTDSGVKQCLRIQTDKAGLVELTADHPILCPDGLFREAGTLRPGDEIVARGSMKLIPTGRPRVYRKRVVVDGLKYHPMAWRKVVIEGDKRYEYGRITKARLVVEATMNKIELDEYIRILKEEPERAETLFFLPREYDVHHADEDPQNDDIGNLVIHLHDDHAALHWQSRDLNKEYREYTVVATITAVQEIGKRRCYDVTMAEPRSNLAVNDGIVVHNCGKSLTAKATATAFGGVPLLRMDLGALKSKWVGESEANLRNAFRIIAAVGRCVVWLDEIEKGLQGATSGSADGGVSADALGAILVWMQERRGEAFVIATSNDVSQLPPEFLRKGRFDDMFFVDLPNDTERREVIKAALREYKRTVDGIDVDALADATSGFTGAEIAALVPEALFAAFADGARPITTDDLTLAASHVAPLSKTAGEKIKRLREWSNGRCRLATSRSGDSEVVVAAEPISKAKSPKWRVPA